MLRVYFTISKSSEPYLEMIYRFLITIISDDFAGNMLVLLHKENLLLGTQQEEDVFHSANRTFLLMADGGTRENPI